ncbi:MAG: C4-type zinc ribbon domain-containing protein [Akkermansiaceae bacterium]|jgi:hypothetical protein|nr:C4-type zinc ribbon domain-containing protein [Akkermansiaceae bacterium]
MFPAIQSLLVIQDRDRRIADLTSQLERLPGEETRAKSRLSSDETAVAAAKKAVLDQGVSIKNLELDIETRKTTIGRLKNQQFETRKNEEYRALGNEVVRYETEVDDLETRLLELMEVADTLKAKHQQAEEALAASGRVVAGDLETIATRHKNLSAQLAETQAERTQLAAAAAGELLDLYERLVRKKGVPGVVPVQNGQCGGCHVKLVAATLIKAQSAPPPVQCETCGRILYTE